jgi:hypothetical protein
MASRARYLASVVVALALVAASSPAHAQSSEVSAAAQQWNERFASLLSDGEQPPPGLAAGEPASSERRRLQSELPRHPSAPPRPRASAWITPRRGTSPSHAR